jgi:hypothetical protein
MGKAKKLLLKPISSKEASALIKRVHYSGKVVQNSQLHIGVYFNGNLEGAMQYGPSLDKRKLMGLVKDTRWNEFIELNRMAFTDVLPRNSESRAIAIGMKLLRKFAPHLKWVISFADATQCGDGAIYRASGFVLTSIKVNQQLYTLPFSHNLDVELCRKNTLTDVEIEQVKYWLDEITPNNGQLVVHKLTVEDRPPKMSLEGAPHAHKMSLEGGHRPSQALSKVKMIMRRLTKGGTSADTFFKAIGGFQTTGYQLRYIYFLDKSLRDNLTVSEIPYSEIEKRGARMYKGQKLNVPMWCNGCTDDTNHQEAVQSRPIGFRSIK